MFLSSKTGDANCWLPKSNNRPSCTFGVSFRSAGQGRAGTGNGVGVGVVWVGNRSVVAGASVMAKMACASGGPSGDGMGFVQRCRRDAAKHEKPKRAIAVATGRPTWLFSGFGRPGGPDPPPRATFRPTHLPLHDPALSLASQPCLPDDVSARLAPGGITGVRLESLSELGVQDFLPFARR